MLIASVQMGASPKTEMYPFAPAESEMHPSAPAAPKMHQLDFFQTNRVIVLKSTSIRPIVFTSIFKIFAVYVPELAVFLCKVNDVVHIRESHGDIGIGRAIINGEPACFGVAEGRAGEADVGNKTGGFIKRLRRHQIRIRPVQYLGGIVQVEQSRTITVDKAVAGVYHAVVNHQPAFTGLDRDGACADF